MKSCLLETVNFLFVVVQNFHGELSIWKIRVSGRNGLLAIPWMIRAKRVFFRLPAIAGQGLSK